MQACFFEHECLGQVCGGGGGGAVKLMLTLVLRPHRGLHGIGCETGERRGYGRVSEREYGQIIC